MIMKKKIKNMKKNEKIQLNEIETGDTTPNNNEQIMSNEKRTPKSNKLKRHTDLMKNLATTV